MIGLELIGGVALASVLVELVARRRRRRRRRELERDRWVQAEIRSNERPRNLMDPHTNGHRGREREQQP